MQEAAVILQERAWVHEAVGDLSRRGKFLLEAIASTTAFSHSPSVRAAIVRSSGVLLPSRPTKSAQAGIISNDPVESLVANLAARRDHSASSKVKLPLVHSQIATVSSDGREVSYSAGQKSPLEQSMEEEDYGWETDPNGGWLSSFP